MSKNTFPKGSTKVKILLIKLPFYSNIYANRLFLLQTDEVFQLRSVRKIVVMPLFQD